jgi:K+-transporting ATPase ATPase C chain
MSGGFYSGASNLSLTSLELQKQLSERLKHLAKDPHKNSSIPHDLLFASASGYDGDISPQAALYQVSSIAKARNIDRGMLQKLVERHIQPKFCGFIGLQKVNVIKLNESLEKLAAKLKSPAGAGMFHIERSLPH